MKEKKTHIIPNDQRLPLTEYFSRLPKATRKPVIISAPKEELVTELARMSGKTKMTARRWVYGHVQPCLAEKEKIAALLKSSVEALFPPKQKGENARDHKPDAYR